MSGFNPGRKSSLIRTVVVDDSAFVRKVVREMLSRSPFIEVVGQARDGEEALAVVRDLKPDVVTCDIQMPGLGGVEFVRKQMASDPVPILILTASPEDGDAVMQAVDAGAVDFVRKPTALATQELLGMREELIEKVKAAAGAPVAKLHALAPAQPVVERMGATSKGRAASSVDAVVIGVSTGGPQALRYLLPQFPADFPVPVLIVLHMPVGYTAMFAEKLDEICELEIIEAGEGTPVQAGQAIVAQAGRHLLVKRNAAGMVRTQLSITPLEKPHRPSVDVLFESAAETYHSRLLGVVMTGMGDDGKQGCAWIKAQGGIVLTEAEESCVIYGMPRVVVDAGLSDASCRLEEMAGTISKYI